MKNPADPRQAHDDDLEAAAADWQEVEERFRKARAGRGRRVTALRFALLLAGYAALRFSWTAFGERQPIHETMGLAGVVLVVVLAVVQERTAKRAEHRAEGQRAALWSAHHHELQRLRRVFSKRSRDIST